MTKRTTIIAVIAGILILSAAGTALWLARANSSPAETTGGFLSEMQKGNARAALKYFGTAGCKCQPPAGWAAYLDYESAQEPNLAWLLNQPCKTTKTIINAEHADAKRPDVHHRLVDVVVEFPAKQTPLLLPVPMAYGAKMSEAALNSFCKIPSTDASKGITLRLRKKLDTGAVATPANLKALMRVQKDEHSTPDVLTPDVLQDLFGDQVAMFLAPKDAGEVVRSDGSSLSKEAVANLLPKVQSTTLQFHLVAKSTDKRWKILECRVVNPVVRSCTGSALTLNTEQSHQQIAASRQTSM